MVKKMFLGAILLVAAISGNAQKAYEGTSFFDNWYLGVNGGGVTPVSHAAFWKNMRGVAGLELGKQVTPVLGISFQGLTAVNTSMSRTAFDALSLSANGKINLNNLFAGYNGEPRLFEVEAIAGIGWGHDFVNSGYGDDHSYVMSRFGASFNFNLGEEKAWSINIKPAMVYRMDGNKPHMLNVNKAGFELLAGVTYHFSGSNGKHYMTIQRPYDADEVCALNCKINALRDEVAAKNAALDESNAKAAQLQRALADCENAPKQVETVVKNLNSMSLESVVTFRQGRTTIASDQIPNVERIATYMKNHPESKVSIKGYASPEGSAEINERIAKQRAEAVKNMLINKYKINANRITAEGQGVGNMFSEPDWNRVSIATLSEKEVE
ncbi:OmpA family protein [uncultured Phocaeicola sp.]|uniref:OmpA family protein n=1 Tax=uncultured Phocaeicola sp. TaxID=990718 RepID=UPI002599A8CA|nr:OmpA family protein [uncultured Phocaeicola sp.]